MQNYNTLMAESQAEYECCLSLSHFDLSRADRNENRGSVVRLADALFPKGGGVHTEFTVTVKADSCHIEPGSDTQPRFAPWINGVVLKALLHQWADAKRNHDMVTSLYLSRLAARVRVRFLLFQDQDKARKYKWQHKENIKQVADANELFGHYRILAAPQLNVCSHACSHTCSHA